MRIRSIKPEFWTSEDIAALDWDTRLIFIGLWSYVDDNGVGRDVERLIVSALFPLEDDPRDTLAKVSRALARLAEGSLITRYEADGKPYLHICTWNKHQRIDRPGKPRYPAPTCGDTDPRDTLATPSRDIRDGLDAGEGEKGSRGEGDSPTAGAAAPAPEASVVALFPTPAAPAIPDPEEQQQTAQTLVGTWIRHCKQRPPENVIGQVSKQLRQLLSEGIHPDDVSRGLAQWHRKGLHPSTLPSVVNEVMNAGPKAPANQDIDWDAAMARARARMENAQ